MMQALAALLGAAWTVFACYSLGSAAVSWTGAALRGVEKLVLGASFLHVLVFATLALEIAYVPVLVTLLAAASCAGVLTGVFRVGAWGELEWPSTKWGAALKYCCAGTALVFTALYFPHAWAPEFSADGSSYHLGLVARYLRAHGFEQVTTSMYASLSGGVEMLFVPAFAIGGHRAAALVHFTFLIAVALAMFAYGARLGQPAAGAAAALLMYASPVVGKDAVSAYVDVGAAAAAFSVYYWLHLWMENRNPRLLAAAGLLAGYCYAAKYTVFVMVIYAVAFVAWHARRIRPVCLVAGLSLLTAAPWAVKNWIYVDNPIAPFANQIFRNRYVHPELERSWRQDLRKYQLESRWTLPLEATVRGRGIDAVTGPIFLLAPMGLFALRRKEGRWLLAAGGLILATYFNNVSPRFLIPALPFVSLAMTLAWEGFLPLLVILVSLHAVTSWPQVLFRYSNPWAVRGLPIKAALGLTPPEEFLGKFPGYRHARMIETHVPPGGRVLAFAYLPDAYTSREVVVSYQAAFNEELIDGVYLGISAQGPQWGRLITFTFLERSARGIRIVQTAVVPRPSEQWSVHEVHFMRRGQEVPRSPEWRLDAFPSPWNVARAFDGSPVTRWRSWETAAPGMYVRVDFGQPVALDEVRVEMPEDEWETRMRVEFMDEKGNWTPLAAEPKEVRNHIAGSLRREATREMHAKGVDYLFVKDEDNGAANFLEEFAEWGLALVAREHGAAIYRVVP